MFAETNVSDPPTKPSRSAKPEQMKQIISRSACFIAWTISSFSPMLMKCVGVSALGWRSTGQAHFEGSDADIDLRRVNTPAYCLSTREDHIAPWKSTYRGPRLLGAPERFVLASDHTTSTVTTARSRRRLSLAVK